MKKTLIILICAVLCMPLLFGACSGGDRDNKKGTDQIVTDGEEQTEGSEEASTEETKPKKKGEDLPEFNTNTEYDYDDLRNWNEEALMSKYGVDSVFDFTPSDPQPMTYIISASEVIDPVTGEPSEGGYDHDYARHLPIDTEDFVESSGILWGGGLTLTDDPDKATFALIIDLDYDYDTGTFHFGDDDSEVIQYHAATKATLLDMVTDESISMEPKQSFATTTGESVYESMLDAAKGKQLYSDSESIYAEDFSIYWEFVAGGQRREKVWTAENERLTVMTILPNYFDVLTRREFTDYLNDQGAHSVTLQKDGCVTVIVSEDEKLGIKSALEKSADDLSAQLCNKIGAEKLDYSSMYSVYFKTSGECDEETFESYASRLQFYGKIYVAMDNEPGYRVSVTLENEDGDTIYELDSALMD